MKEGAETLRSRMRPVQAPVVQSGGLAARLNADGGHRRERAEVRIPGRDGYAMTQCRRGDPGVVAADAATGLQLGRGDAGEAARNLRVDWEERPRPARSRDEDGVRPLTHAA